MSFIWIPGQFNNRLSAQYQNLERKSYTTTRLQVEPPRINGVLDDTCWDQGVWATGFTQVSPYEGNPTSQETDFKILYDNKYIYVAIRCHDHEPEKIEIRKAPRDGYSGDVAGIAFDSYFDHRTAFEFDLTAAGGKMDLVHQNIGKFDRNWDAVWDGKTALEDSAWTAEMKIPLSQLRYPDKEEQVWGFHVFRIIYRTMEINHFNLIPMDAPLLVPLFGELHGINGLEKSRRIELLPYLVGKINTFKKEAENPFASTGTKFGYGIGLDGKIGLATNITLDFTVNPDFGQVEADPSVMNLTAFEVFYNEKRPFFLEGTSILTYDLGKDKVFYTRRIGHAPGGNPETAEGEYVSMPDQTTIISALKVTGKTESGLSIGVVESITADEKAEISDGDETRKQIVEPFTNYLVTRIQQDFREGNTIVGGIFTSTNRHLSEPYLEGFCRSAYSGGFDFTNYWKDQTYYLDLKTIYSQVRGSNESIINQIMNSVHYYQRPGADYLSIDSSANILTGHGGNIEAGRGGNGRLRFSENFNWRSPGLELNDLGFLKMADIFSQKTRAGWDVIDPNKLFLRYSIYLEQENAWNFGGEYIHSSVGTEYTSRFHNYWNITAGIKRISTTLDSRILRGGPSFKVPGNWDLIFGLTSDTRKKFSASLNVLNQSFDDRSRSVNLVPALDYRISSALQVNLNASYLKNIDNHQYVTKVSSGDNKHYLLSHLDQQTFGITLRMDYYITPDLSIRYYGSPFLSTGIYSGFKKVVSPEANDPDKRCYQYDGDELSYDQAERKYYVDENLDGLPDYSFNNPDFNFMQFRSNFVVRWEFKPGSNLYFVWTHDRTGFKNVSNESIGEGFSNLVKIYPDNIFLVKFNYWFSV
ncbi:MAG: hypothetical protein AMS27_08530 [Bacteroides sp. SM23_62_1]|nr:MAG: hypothetical protein AMS27_08530 [Bacteroides sp. SM23_62_1]